MSLRLCAQDAKNWFERYQREEEKAFAHTTECKCICEAGHHRIEQRCFISVPAKRVFNSSQLKQWAGLQTLIVEQSSRQLWNKTTHSTRFFLSSLAADFAHFPNSIRSHWGVENQLHWCLDVIFSEDDSRIRKDHAPRNMTILRRLALNLLRQDTSSGSLKMKRYQAGLNNNFLLRILSNSGIF